jgi:hypothetical protein
LDSTDNLKGTSSGPIVGNENGYFFR